MGIGGPGKALVEKQSSGSTNWGSQPLKVFPFQSSSFMRPQLVPPASENHSGETTPSACGGTADAALSRPPLKGVELSSRSITWNTALFVSQPW